MLKFHLYIDFEHKISLKIGLSFLSNESIFVIRKISFHGEKE